MTLFQYLPIALVISHLSFAETAPSLHEAIQAQIAEVENALSKSADNEIIDESWYFQNLWIRSRLSVGFALPGLASIAVVPELEFLIQRDLPEEWQIYHP